MRLKREMKWSLVLCAAVFIALGSAAPVHAAPVPEGLALSSDEPGMVIAISSIQNITAKVAKLNDAAAINLLPLTEINMQLHNALKAPKSIRDEGPLAVVVPKGAAASVPGGFDWGAIPKVMLLTTTDYSQFVSGLGGDVAEAGATSIKPMGDRPGFARSLPGGIAAISGKKELLSGYTPLAGGATKLLDSAGPIGARVLTNADIAIYINMREFEPSLTKSLQTSLDEADKALDATIKTSDPAGYVMKRVWNRMYGDAVKALIRDTTVLAIGIEFQDSGVVVNVVAQFKPGSFMATATNGSGDVSGIMAKFPLDPFTIAFVTNTQSLGIKQAFEEASLKYGPVERPTAEGKLLRKAAAVVEKTRSIGHVSYAAQPGDPHEPSLWLLETTDPKSFITAFREFVATFPEYQPTATLPTTLGGTGAPAKSGFKPGASYSPSILTIDGSPVDQYELTLGAPDAFVKGLPVKLQPFFAEMVTSGRTGYLASFNNLVVVTTSPDAQIVRQALLAARQTSGLGSDPSLTELRAQQIAKPGFEAYLSVSTASTLFAEWLGRPGVTPPEVARDLAPLSITGASDAGGLNVRVLLPYKLLRYVSGHRVWYASLFGPPNAAGKPAPIAIVKRPKPAVDPARPAPTPTPTAAPTPPPPAARPTPPPPAAPSAPPPSGLPAGGG